jgi:hypothetical protein
MSTFSTDQGGFNEFIHLSSIVFYGIYDKEESDL